VKRTDATRFGLLKREDDCRITSFAEKPKDAKTKRLFVSRDDVRRPYLGSMGIYLFNIKVLVDVLTSQTKFDDFGGDVIPAAINSHAVYGFDFDGYWQDIGTIRSFYETNLALTMTNSPFNFYDPERPIYTHARYLPGSIVEDSRLENVLIADGCRIKQSRIKHSIVGIRSQISTGCTIRDSILMGADYYSKEAGKSRLNPIGIGRDSTILGAILDKNARIAEGVIIRPFPRGTELDRGTYYVRDGIVVVPKDTEIAAGTKIGP